MSAVLPERPDLAQLRRRAKELLAAARSGEDAAVRRLAAYSAQPKLSDAQLAIAREYGFASWPRLTVEVQRKSAIESGDTDALARILATHPALAAERVSSTLSRKKATALEYVAVAGFHGSLDHADAAGLARVLIAAGAPVNGRSGRGETPLITAASYGETEMVQLLIDAGADLESVGTAVPGGTALAHAVEYGLPEVVDVLLAVGAVVHDLIEAAGADRLDAASLRSATSPQRAAALRAAAMCGRVGAIAQILASGVDVDADLAEGATALHWAAFRSAADGVAALLAAGADPSRRDDRYELDPLGWYAFRQTQLAETHSPLAWANRQRIEGLLAQQD